MIDIDGSDTLSLAEVVVYLKSITDNLSEENIENIFNKVDTDQNKTIDLIEFKVILNCVPRYLIFFVRLCWLRFLQQDGYKLAG